MISWAVNVGTGSLETVRLRVKSNWHWPLRFLRRSVFPWACDAMAVEPTGPISQKNPGSTRRVHISGVQETLPPVLLGRLHLSRPSHVPHIVNKASDGVTSERAAASEPPLSARKPLLAAAGAAAATPRALSSRATSRGSAGSVTATGSTLHEDHKPKHFTAWTQLRTRELAPMPDVEELLGIGPAVSFGHGLLWPGTFQQYAIGWMPGMSLTGACLGVAEFGRLLRENHVILDYASRCRILELAVGRGAQIIDFPALLSFVEATARSVTLAEDLRASGGLRRGRRKRVRQPEKEVDGEKLHFCLEPKEVTNRGEVEDCAGNLSGMCRACTERISKFAQLLDWIQPGPEPLLLGEEGMYVAFNQEVSEKNVDGIRANRDQQERSPEVSAYNFIVVDRELLAQVWEATFRFAMRYPTLQGGFQHVHFTFEDLTPPHVAAKIKQLSNYMNGSFDNRFQKLIDDPASLNIIQEEIPNLVRPDHWKAVTSWAVNFVAKAEGRKWSELPMHKKFEIMAFAMLTGRSHGAIHTDMQQAGNLVDFITDAHSRAALRALMDDRSNPETYQVSRVAGILRDKAVTSLCTVTLTWGGEGQPNKSDLDLHTMVDGVELYYNRKVVGKCQLDFDANAQTVEAFPAENISLNQPGTFTIRVNNYRNRDSASVPFQVTVKKPGSSEVYTDAWDKNRAPGSFMEICTVTVTPEDETFKFGERALNTITNKTCQAAVGPCWEDLVEEPVELSAAEQKRLAAKEEEWMRMVGEPRSAVATDASIADAGGHEMVLVKSAAFSKSSCGSAQAAFASMLTAPAKGEDGKASLATRCKLGSLSGLIEHISENPCSLMVDPRNFVPGYVTRLQTETDVLFENFAINVYHRKNELPQAPRSDEQSTVRFDASWGVSSMAAVHGFIKLKNRWFMVLKGAHLPKDPSWPRGGGMYPTNLKPEAHHHRSKWVSFHALVLPEEPATGVPLIGSALVGFPSFRFILDGKEISASGSSLVLLSRGCDAFYRHDTASALIEDLDLSEAAVAVLQAVFNSYDRDGQGQLCREDYMRLVRDRGQVPRTPEEFHDLHRQVAFCREDGLPGPLDFAAFIRFVTYLSGAGCA
ncbi:TMEM63A [Symbiodinium sp. KB8]|nr:TMEM63A [Symbiodinium sp. KB8]